MLDKKFGENPFKGLFSVFAIAILVWMILVFIDAARGRTAQRCAPYQPPSHGLGDDIHCGDGASALLIFFGNFVVLGLIGSLLDERRRATKRTAKDDIYFAHTSFVPFAAILQKRTKMVWSEMGLKSVIIGVVMYAVLLVLYETLFGIAPIGFVLGDFD